MESAPDDFGFIGTGGRTNLCGGTGASMQMMERWMLGSGTLKNEVDIDDRLVVFLVNKKTFFHQKELSARRLT